MKILRDYPMSMFDDIGFKDFCVA